MGLNRGSFSRGRVGRINNVLNLLRRCIHVLIHLILDLPVLHQGLPLVIRPCGLV